jgi:plasmid maintenance system antidote protein VapI
LFRLLLYSLLYSKTEVKPERDKRAIPPDTALRLARFFNNSPELWLHPQQLHDLTKAKLALTKTIEAELPVYEPSAA